MYIRVSVLFRHRHLVLFRYPSFFFCFNHLAFHGGALAATAVPVTSWGAIQFSSDSSCPRFLLLTKSVYAC